MILAQDPVGFRNRAEDMIRRRRWNGIDQRATLRVELVIPAASHRVHQVMLVQALQRRAGVVGGARLACFSPRDPCLGHLGLRPAAPGGFSDVVVGIALGALIDTWILAASGPTETITGTCKQAVKLRPG